VALRWAVGIEVARLPELVVLAVFAMVAAVAVVQALVALFGTRGWFVALLLVVVQAAAAGAWYPIETAPELIQALHPLLPMTYAVEGFRTLVAGGAASIAPALVVLALWTVGALAVTLLATRLRMSHAGPRPEPLAVGGGAG
jgi:putative membrane protein